MIATVIRSLPCNLAANDLSPSTKPLQHLETYNMPRRVHHSVSLCGFGTLLIITHLKLYIKIIP